MGHAALSQYDEANWDELSGAMADFGESRCIACGRPSAVHGQTLSCVNEVAEVSPSADGKTATVWRVTAKEEWLISICPSCAKSKYGDRLVVEVRKAKKFFILGFVSLTYHVWFLACHAIRI